jgi:hypothetical protein
LVTIYQARRHHIQEQNNLSYLKTNVLKREFCDIAAGTAIAMQKANRQRPVLNKGLVNTISTNRIIQVNRILAIYSQLPIKIKGSFWVVFSVGSDQNYKTITPDRPMELSDIFRIGRA